jgi:ribosomal-protein-serine acetyltransferase
MRSELTNGAIKIRRYRPEDAVLLFKAARESVNEMFPFVPWCHANYAVSESESFISSSQTAWEEGSNFNFAVFDCKSDLFLGGVGLSRINRKNNFANLGYWVRSSQTKRGIATGAAILAAEFGLKDLGLTRIEIIMAVENVASRKVAEKMGAKREGVLRNRLILHDRLHDALMYSLIPADRSI